MDSPNGTSYDTICAAERSPPMSEYLLLEAHPPRFGPSRACMSPSVRRSIQFMAATMTWTMMKATRNLTTGQMRYFMKRGLIAVPHGNSERRMRMQNEESFSILHSNFCVLYS